MPPLLHIPGRVVDLSVRQDASELVASWTWPELGTEGQIFRETERFEVFAAFIPPGGSVPSVDAMAELGEIAATVPAESTETVGPGLPIQVQAPLDTRFGTQVAFAVRSVSTRGKLSPWSDLKLLDVVQPLAGPADLTATTLEEGVHLTWEPVEGAVNYEVERRIGDGEFVAIGRPADPEFVDNPQWGESHVYRVRSRKSAGASPDVAGLPSSVASLLPMDVFPPVPPVDLRALATEAGVELSWASNTEPDLAGYRVQRDGSPAHEGLIESANFSGLPVPAGESVRFEVVAVDRAGNSSAPAEASVVAPL